MSVQNMAIAPVRKSVTVRTDPATAFDVFTKGIDMWWLRSHHIGASDLEKVVIEAKVGGRCYERGVDGSECDWGQVLVWDPPQRFAFSWQITPEWKPQPDVAKSSEVEVRFTALESGLTRVDLEHRHFERHGSGAEAMRAGVDAPNGWSGLLDAYSQTTQTMRASANPRPATTSGPLAYVFALNDGLIRRALDGLTDEQAWARVSDQNNSMLWIIAHAISVRAGMLKMLGETVDTGWGDAFARGSTPNDATPRPTRDEILRVHDTVATHVKTRLALMTEAELSAPAIGTRIPNATTVAEQIGFFTLHDSYHVGQLGYIRKALIGARLVG
jgi:DinB superfamily/Activator of Hsp90 ATPase homolog 1-like protein